MTDPLADRLPDPILATAADLPPAVARALAQPPQARRLAVAAAGLRWAAAGWGDREDPPLLLIHGVTSSSATWWRVGPALAAAGYHVVAVDQAAHGETRGWPGHPRFRDNAADVAAFVAALRLGRDDLHVIGHSWGAMTAAALPAAGLVPAVLVLLDPPALPRRVIEGLLDDPTEHRYDDLDEAVRVVRLANPGWSDGDVAAKAQGLTAFDESAVRAVLLENDWDGGLADLGDPAARAVPVWIVRGEVAAGSYVADHAIAGLAERVGAERLLTISGGPHSPHRTLPEATVVALLRALAPAQPTRTRADRRSSTARR